MRVVGLSAIAWLVLRVAAGSAMAGADEPPSPLNGRLPAADSARELERVLGDVRAAVRAGARPVVVFDIDDTVVGWRKENGRKVSSAPMPGAYEYLHALTRAGARIVYLTGRPRSARRETLRVLRSMRLPLGRGHRLLMNPRPAAASIVEWKASARPRIEARGEPVAFFDNDLANVRMFRREYPRARVIRVAGHSGTGDPDPGRGIDGIRVVGDFAAWAEAMAPVRRADRARGHRLARSREGKRSEARTRLRRYLAAKPSIRGAGSARHRHPARVGGRGLRARQR